MSETEKVVADLRAVLTDWDGTDIPDAELPRIDVLCGTLRRAADLIAHQAARLEEVTGALATISYHYDNQDLSHLDFRVKAAECARAALSEKEQGA